MDTIKNPFKHNTFFTHPTKNFDYFLELFKYYGLKKKKTFKAEKKILEDFFKNRKINTFREDSLTFREDEYKIFDYNGKIKNLQELNVKNSFDLLEYLKPYFVYIASDIETIKEEIKKEHTGNLTMYQNYYFYITIYLPNIDT